jgi:integrase
MKCPQPYFREFDGWWYVQIREDGRRRQLKLAKGKDKEAEAWARYHRIMAGERVARTVFGDAAVVALDEFLDYAITSLAPATAEWYGHFLKPFAKHIGDDLALAGLEPSHVTEFLKQHSTWSKTTKNCAVRAIRRAVRWYCTEKKLAYPLMGLKAPPRKRREVIVSKEQFAAILQHVRGPQFKWYLQFLAWTGARPQEARAVEMRHCDLQLSRIVFPPSESKGGEYPRVIYLNEEAKALVAKLCKVWPTGPIFRNSHGKPWDKNSVRCRFRRMRNKFGKLCAYHLRHTWATTALQTLDPITVAVLMGHSDVSQLARTYQHLAKNPTLLTEAAKKATAGA